MKVPHRQRGVSPPVWDTSKWCIHKCQAHSNNRFVLICPRSVQPIRSGQRSRLSRIDRALPNNGMQRMHGKPLINQNLGAVRRQCDAAVACEDLRGTVVAGGLARTRRRGGAGGASLAKRAKQDFLAVSYWGVRRRAQTSDSAPYPPGTSRRSRVDPTENLYSPRARFPPGVTNCAIRMPGGKDTRIARGLDSARRRGPREWRSLDEGHGRWWTTRTIPSASPPRASTSHELSILILERV
jgi:hypothetical protein